ncbi:MAG: hypothetical protein JW715_16135 [Sedimentisphaerales bacterium]|nr:hypothetical protein [Sedimentisphaerales bacterium]
MTEAQTQNDDKSESCKTSIRRKKKSGLTSRVFKWLFLSILTVLFLLALAFDAPPKIFILILIFITAFTALPKPYCKYFWLTSAGVVIALIVWIFLPEEDTGWRPYTFDEELAALEAKYAIPNEENAALIYDSLLKDYERKTMNPDFLDRDANRLTYSEQWTSEEYPELAEWIKQQQDTIQTLFKAAKKDKCRFPINVQLEVTDKMEINRLSAVRSWALILLRAANNDMAEGRTERALEKYLCAIRFTNHLNQQRIIYMLMGCSLQEQTLIALNRFLIDSEPTAEQIQLISDTVEGDLQDNWSSDFSRWFETEVLFWKNAFGLFYEVNPDGKIRFRRKPSPVINHFFLRNRFGRFFRDKKANKICAIPAWFFLPSTPQKAAETIEAVMDKYHPMTRPDYDWNKTQTQSDLRFKLNYNYMVKSAIIKENSTEQFYRSYHDMYLEQLTLRRGTRLLVAIRQYKNENGKWPESFDSIKNAAPAEAFLDPVTGKSLQYENHGKRFSLYGANTNVWPR